MVLFYKAIETSYKSFNNTSNEGEKIGKNKETNKYD